MAKPQIRETRVKSWKALLEVLHSTEMVQKQERQGGHYRSPYVFRGMSVSKWPLETSLERLKSPSLPVVEPALLRSFRKFAPRGTFARDSDWEALSVAQHNGLPTRLLDWSVSPLIAAHFATAERQYFSEDGVVWCVDITALRDEVLPPEVAKPIRSTAAVFDVVMLEKVYRRLADFDATRAAFGELCLFFEPPSLDARIANQTGILSTMNGAAVSHQDYLNKLAAVYPGLVRRVVIDKAAKHQIRDMLDQNNIHERMLFPGLPGLCAWLRRYYGPA